MKVAFLFSFFGKITYENEIAVSTKNTIAHTWLTRLAALFKTIPDSNQLPHCSNGINPYAKKRICAHQRIKQDVIPNFYFLLCISMPVNSTCSSIIGAGSLRHFATDFCANISSFFKSFSRRKLHIIK